MKYCELTKYPRIYANTYWGRFDCECADEIIAIGMSLLKNLESRSNFYQSASIIELRNGVYWSYFDHTECYFNGKSYIVITSPHGTYEDEFMHVTGFFKYKKLYSQDANTYIKVVQKTH